MTNEDYMREALRIAKNARGRTSPNPMVGAVIVKEGRIIAEGWHKQAGTNHAEINALNMAGDCAKGSTMYVTLEPCSHFGKTPPCVDAIINAGIKKIYIAVKDPNPQVDSVQLLKDAGIEVEVGLLEEEARHLNEVFFKWITKKLPFVTMKTAMTFDGKIATANGLSKWITSDESRQRVHEMRDIYDAIMVGIGTVLKDNPTLTARIRSGKNPIRIIVDSKARTPIMSNVVIGKSAQTIIAVSKSAPKNRIEALKSKGVEVMYAGEGEQVDLKLLMSELANRNITSVMVEGGGTLNFSLLQEGLVDKMYAFIAAKIIGGYEAITSVEGKGVDTISDAILLKDIKTELIGNDILIKGYIDNNRKKRNAYAQSI